MGFGLDGRLSERVISLGLEDDPAVSSKREIRDCQVAREWKAAAGSRDQQFLFSLCVTQLKAACLEN
jgi:hypothetical protein